MIIDKRKVSKGLIGMNSKNNSSFYLIKKPAVAFILVSDILLLLFVGLLAYYEVAPQKLLHIYYGKIFGLAGNPLPNPVLHPDNAGIISALNRFFRRAGRKRAPCPW